MRAARRSCAVVVSVVTCGALAACGNQPPLTPAASALSTPPPPAQRVSARPTPRSTLSPTPEPSVIASRPTTSCAELARELSLAEQVGQLLMVGVDSGGISAAEGDILHRTHAGSVILLGNSTAGAAAVRRVVGDVRDATRRPHGVRTMMAADQEGGLVQRLKGPGFVTIPSAVDQRRQSNRQLNRNARMWGQELKDAGIDADLAPVADVVPAELVNVNEPIGRLRRGYSSSPRVVAAKVAAFTEGMDAAGIITATKHFPGLGRVRGNTDFSSRVVDSTTIRHDPALAGFDSAVESGVDMVMMSSAYYSRIDADHRAAFSSRIIAKMVRRDLGFTGVVISDDLAAVAMRDLPPADRALQFVKAGGDLLIVGDPQLASAMANALTAEARDDPHFAALITRSATLVLAMKAKRALAPC